MPFDGRELSPIAAHLLRARQYIEDRGWCSNGAMDAEGRVCMATAVARTRTIDYDTGWWLGKAIGVEPSHVDGHSIGTWNDAQGRTLEEVLDAFDRAVVLVVQTGEE